MKRIIHIDMDAFYASVEQRDDPELKGKPVVVGSDSARGVIAAASYEARKYGVRSAMPSSVAKRLCPDLIFMKNRMKRYKEISNEVFDIFYTYSQKVEALSVDEAFIDLGEDTTGLSSAISTAEKIRADIRMKLHLTASAGVSYNKFLAKLASGMNKPDGIYVIDHKNSEGIILNLPVDSFYGIGKVTADRLHRLGIHTGSDLRKADLDFLTRNFGKAGHFYYNICRGEDKREVETGRERKSVGAEYTFDTDLLTQFQIIAELYKIEKELWERIGRHGKSGRTITLKVRFSDFSQLTRSHTLDKPVDSFAILHAEVTKIRETVDFKRKRVRLMGVTISNLNKPGETDVEQLNLW